MADMRRVRLTNAALENGVNTSTYFYENFRYFLQGKTPMNVRVEVANSWVTADSNVTIDYSDKE